MNYFIVTLINYDHNNIPRSSEHVIKSSYTPSKTDVKEYFDENTDIAFEEVKSIIEIDEDEALDYVDDLESIAEI